MERGKTDTRVPAAPVSNFESIREVSSRLHLPSTDICKAGVATLAPNILHITIRIHEGFNALFTRKVANG